MSIPDPTPINITLFGDGGCGKSSITLRLVRSQWTSDYDPTIEDSYTLTRAIDGQTYHLALTDTAGQEEYRGMWGGANLHHADAFLLVYDITNARSLEGLEYFHQIIRMEEDGRYDAWRAHQTAQPPRSPRPGFIPPIKMVAGNKCDLAEMREVSARAGLEWARTHDCGFMETSARNTVNIEETFELMVRRVVEARLAAGLAHQQDGDGRGGSRGHSDDVEEVIGDEGPGGMGGTRRAMTRPLSPLAGEKGVTLPLAPAGRHTEMYTGESPTRWTSFKSWCRRVLCGGEDS